MKAYGNLPDGYKEIYSIDLQKDKKMALLVNLLSVLIAAAAAVPMHFYIPFWTLYDMSVGIGVYFLRLVVMLVGLVAYIVLHELVHGVTMKIMGTKKVKYGFTGLYAFAGSEDYYDKSSYIIIALAPIVVWGIVLAVIGALVPVEWFWAVYIIQIINLSGAAGDLFVSFRFAKLPSDILVRDYGVGMTVYSSK